MAKPLKFTPSSATGSIAELVTLTAAHRIKMFDRHKNNIVGEIKEENDRTLQFKNIADALPKVKRLSYDDSLLRLVNSTYSIETEDVIGQLSHVSFPFDQFWIEGVSARPRNPDTSISVVKTGALITANQENNSFTFRHVHEYAANPTSDNPLDARSLHYFRDNRTLTTLPIVARVSMNGFDLDEANLLKHMEREERENKRRNSIGDPSILIDEAYVTADFLTRILVVLSSPNVPNNFRAPKTREELALEAKNKRRKDMGFAPILPVSPVRIDLAQINPRLFEVETPREARQLLGWTSVRRSKQVTHPDGTLWLRKKDGKPWTRSPHERKIAAPVDRRDAEREIFSSSPNLTVSIDDGRPIKVRHDGTPTDKPVPSK